MVETLNSLAGSSIYYSLLFLPNKKQKDLLVVYNLYKTLAAIVDKCTEQSIAEAKIAWWHEEIYRIFRGSPQHPMGKKIMSLLTDYPLKQTYFEELIHGISMDIKYHGYDTFDDLKTYCHYTFSCIMLLTCEIIGYKHKQTLKYAQQMGIAIQLMRMVRHLGKHARCGKIYLPEQELQEYQVNPHEILNLSINNKKGFIELLKTQVMRARQHYANALEILPRNERPSQIASLINGKINLTILQEIEHSQFNILNQSIDITALRKLWVALSCKTKTLIP